jgi:hypothetical protein
MQTIRQVVSPSVLIALAGFSIVGCTQPVLRENVLATTQSVIGVHLSQNPTTQLYEARVGFARNEFFFVPTSKRVVYDASGHEAAGTRDALSGADHHQATPTPNVLAEIMADGAIPGPSGGAAIKVGVYQRLAVGDEAVKQPAAIALFARDSQTAAAIINSAEFGNDDASDRIRKWADASPENRSKLAEWLLNQPVASNRVRVSRLINAANLADLRQRAVKELSIPE